MRNLRLNCLVLVILACLLTACSDVEIDEGADAQGHSAPTQFTAAANKAVANSLPLADQQDFDDARRGFIARSESLRIVDAAGTIVWDMPAYDFIDGKSPASVNPSLWRQAQLNNIHGLFKVTEGIYQLRGFDLSNMTIIESDNGWIVVDPLTANETSAAAIAFAREQLGDKPIVAIIFTHSHIDHFGGVAGIVEMADIQSGKVQVIAPSGFTEEATSENVLAGSTMGRRSMFMYGSRLARSARGHVGSGLGKSPALGSVSIADVSHTISESLQPMIIDGVEFIFQNVPGSEAPAEMAFYLPASKTFCGAEIVSRTMHNLYTLRGAKVRDGLKWSNYIDEAILNFGDADTYFASHHWPMWGNERIIEFLEKQRDTYKFIHDQTLRLAAQGHTPREIAESVKLPESLAQNFPTRGYYGTTKHNTKAVYQGYFGWYDGNPANLDPLPPTEAATRYVAMMGGAEAVLAQAKTAYDNGEYRWVAQILDHLVFAEPRNAKARALLANTYDQLGYQAESGPWRDIYLSGAYELRHGAPKQGLSFSRALDLMRATPIPRFLDAMATNLDASKAAGEYYVINIELTDRNVNYVLTIDNSVLHHRQASADQEASATIKLTHEMFLKIILGEASLQAALFSDDIVFEGSQLDVLGFFSLLGKPDDVFNIIEP